MERRLCKKCNMKCEIQRNILSDLAKNEMNSVCAPPPYLRTKQGAKAKECLCVSQKKGSLTVEAALILPFFMMVLFFLFSLFYQYSVAADLKTGAAAEAKKTALAVGILGTETAGDITICRSEELEGIQNPLFSGKRKITQSAVCRPWIGFTKLEEQETYVYITPEGSVYHLTADCTHLELSIHTVSLKSAKTMKNQYGESYKKCELCKEVPGNIVYITEEGNRYHSRRGCSGLKRTVRLVPLRSVLERSCCLRCREKEE